MGNYFFDESILNGKPSSAALPNPTSVSRDKRAAMETYWIPGVNRMGKYGRWAFLELRDPFQMRAEFEGIIKKNEGSAIFFQSKTTCR
ncbi:MAG: hypothetical protein LBU17_09940 [Treponema sp.]|jgi:hypothetical protein|nr:hypothetical protein [Treponema sp.]